MLRTFTYIFFIFLSFSATAQVFSEISDSLALKQMHVDKHAIGGGAAWFDINNDGYQDFYVTGGDERDHLYLNQKNGTFTEIGIAAGLGTTNSIKTVGVVTGDIDNDGYRDIFVTTDEHHHNLLFKNNGNNTFTESSSTSGIMDTAWSTSAVFGDYNLDGYLDIYVANYVDYNDSASSPFFMNVNNGLENYLYKNNGNGTFTEVANKLNVNEDGSGLVVIFTDYDLDNDLDIYVGNDNGIWTNKNVMYRNEYPLDSFTNVSSITKLDFGLSNMGLAVGDFDEDQQLDIYLTDLLKNILAKNNGNNTYTDVAQTQSVQITNRVCWGTFFLDYNNDTYPDLFVATGNIMGPANLHFQLDQVFKNKKGNYSNAPLNEGINDSTRARGATWCDFDLDGDQDLLVIGTEFDTTYITNLKFYENTSTADSNWIDIKVQGTKSNRDGYGTKVSLFANGRNLIQELSGGSSYLSQNPTVAHFGLGSIAKVDSVILTWPGGAKQTIQNLNTKQRLTFLEGALYSNDSVSICNNDSVLIGNEYRNIEGLYFDSLSTTVGDDSIVMTYLMVYKTSARTDSLTICKGDSLLFGNSYISLPGLYLDTLINAESCDSLYYLHLFNNPSYNFITDTTTKVGDSVLVYGKYYSQAGVYVDSFYTNLGCDSLYTVKLSIDSNNISVSEIERLEQYFSIYPNPATDRINIELNTEINVQSIVLTNALGEEILRKENPQNPITELNVSQLKAGTFIVKINTQFGVYYKVVVISR